jgi:hypothetical protein
MVRSLHHCEICGKDVTRGKSYHDGGPVASACRGYDDYDDTEDDEEFELNTEEHEYLLSLLKADHISEEDAELVLRLMEDHSLDVLDYLPTLIRSFPGLAKRMYYFCEKLHDKREVGIFDQRFHSSSLSGSDIPSRPVDGPDSLFYPFYFIGRKLLYGHLFAA